jgi:hypothetical protein
MNNIERQPFSKKWMFGSMASFITVELILGGMVGSWVGGYMSISLRFMLQGLLHIVSFFIGGLIIGLVSPGIGIFEPAVGAFLSVSAMLILTIFTPYSFIHFSLTKLLIGGAIAFALALYGARIGEKLAGNRLS